MRAAQFFLCWLNVSNHCHILLTISLRHGAAVDTPRAAPGDGALLTGTPCGTTRRMSVDAAHQSATARHSQPRAAGVTRAPGHELRDVVRTPDRAKPAHSSTRHPALCVPATQHQNAAKGLGHDDEPGAGAVRIVSARVVAFERCRAPSCGQPLIEIASTYSR
jgi:hypothetical protein